MDKTTGILIGAFYVIIVLFCCSRADNPVEHSEHPEHPETEEHPPIQEHPPHPPYPPIEIIVNVNGVDIVYTVGDTIFLNCDDDNEVSK